MKLDDPKVDPMLMEGDMLGKWAGKLRDRKRASRLQCAWSRALPPGSSPLDPRLVPVPHQRTEDEWARVTIRTLLAFSQCWKEESCHAH